MSVSGKKVFSELSLEQAGTRGNVLSGKPDISAKPILQVKTGAPDEMDQLTNATANMAIATPAEAEKAAKKQLIIFPKEFDEFADSMLKDQVPATDETEGNKSSLTMVLPTIENGESGDHAKNITPSSEEKSEDKRDAEPRLSEKQNIHGMYRFRFTFMTALNGIRFWRLDSIALTPLLAC
jgi:hypothetical protein